MRRDLLLVVAALLVAAPAIAQPTTVAEAIKAGKAGERYDGYMGFVGDPSPELRRQVSAINLRRRNLYIQLADRRNVTAQLVGMATACQLLSQLTAGEAYQLSDGVWRLHSPGQKVALPNYCR